MGKRLGTSAQGYRAMASGITTPTLQDNLRLLAGPSPAIVAPADSLVKVMLGAGLLKHGVSISGALDSGIEGCITQ
jgi:hypothetical protein